MNIDRLRYLAAVVETKNLRKAAELVGIAPASMSKAIGTLEGEIGFDLIRPEGRGIAITDRGLEVYRASAVLLDEYRRFQNRVLSPMSENIRTKIRFATFEVFSSYLLSTFFKEIVPDEEALLLEHTPGKIEDAIMSGLVDYGLTYLAQPSEKLEFTEVGRFEMKIFGRPEWRSEAFSSWPFAIPTTEINIHAQDHQSLDLWPDRKIKRYVKYQFELLETALQTSRMGLSVLHCPDFVVKLHNQSVKTDFQLIELAAPKTFKTPSPPRIYLVSRKGDPRSVYFERKFAKLIRNIR